MYAKQTTVVNKTGIHARPASDFVQLAGKFKSTITVKNLATEATGDAKSIISILLMALEKGTQIEISAEGEDEVDAVTKMVQLVEDGFGDL